MTVHGACPRCGRVIRIRKDGRQYEHNVKPEDSFFATHCPYSGVTPEDAANRITYLARIMFDKGCIKDPVTGQWWRGEG